MNFGQHSVGRLGMTPPWTKRASDVRDAISLGFAGSIDHGVTLYPGALESSGEHDTSTGPDPGHDQGLAAGPYRSDEVFVIQSVDLPFPAHRCVRSSLMDFGMSGCFVPLGWDAVVITGVFIA